MSLMTIWEPWVGLLRLLRPACVVHGADTSRGVQSMSLARVFRRVCGSRLGYKQQSMQ
jgi:hypothetical protein